jgi:hypothetical protein
MISPLNQAHRARKARRIIQSAFRFSPKARRYVPVRFELIGDCVAVAVLRERGREDQICVKVARLLPDGRAAQMRKECRRGFSTVHAQIDYFESLYRRFANANDDSL